jgi:hypothetical protein
LGWRNTANRFDAVLARASLVAGTWPYFDSAGDDCYVAGSNTPYSAADTKIGRSRSHGCVRSGGNDTAI